MKSFAVLSITMMFCFVGIQAKADEGGVITGGPNAMPDDEEKESPPIKLPGGVFFELPQQNPVEELNEIKSPAKKPWVLEITENEFDRLAIHSIKTKAEEIYVNPEVGLMTPLTVDVWARRIKGVNFKKEAVELIQVDEIDNSRGDSRTMLLVNPPPTIGAFTGS